MALDLAALKARMAAQKAATNSAVPSPNGASNESNNSASQSIAPSSGSNVLPGNGIAGATSSIAAPEQVTSPVPTVSAPDKLGTSKTTEIDHLDFLSKMNSLATAIHTQHPTMPVLLMQIHKQLRADPELVTTLDDDAIGIIVKGLQIQTKTELVAEATKKSSSPRAKKNAALDVSML